MIALSYEYATGFIENKAIKVKPKCPGKYSFDIYAKSIKSTKNIPIIKIDAKTINALSFFLFSNSLFLFSLINSLYLSKLS